MAVTVDTAVGGNRERDLNTGFTIPMKLNLSSALSFVTHPSWAFNYFTKPKWELSNLKNHIDAGTSVMTSIGDYFTQMLDNSLDWNVAQDLLNIREVAKPNYTDTYVQSGLGRVKSGKNLLKLLQSK